MKSKVQKICSIMFIVLLIPAIILVSISCSYMAADYNYVNASGVYGKYIVQDSSGADIGAYKSSNNIAVGDDIAFYVTSAVSLQDNYVWSLFDKASDEVKEVATTNFIVVDTVASISGTSIITTAGYETTTDLVLGEATNSAGIVTAAAGSLRTIAWIIIVLLLITIYLDLLFGETDKEAKEEKERQKQEAKETKEKAAAQKAEEKAAAAAAAAAAKKEAEEKAAAEKAEADKIAAEEAEKEEAEKAEKAKVAAAAAAAAAVAAAALAAQKQKEEEEAAEAKRIEDEKIAEEKAAAAAAAAAIAAQKQKEKEEAEAAKQAEKERIAAEKAEQARIKEEEKQAAQKQKEEEKAAKAAAVAAAAAAAAVLAAQRKKEKEEKAAAEKAERERIAREQEEKRVAEAEAKRQKADRMNGVIAAAAALGAQKSEQEREAQGIIFEEKYIDDTVDSTDFEDVVFTPDFFERLGEVVGDISMITASEIRKFVSSSVKSEMKTVIKNTGKDRYKLSLAKTDYGYVHQTSKTVVLEVNLPIKYAESIREEYGIGESVVVDSPNWYNWVLKESTTTEQVANVVCASHFFACYKAKKAEESNK